MLAAVREHGDRARAPGGRAAWLGGAARHRRTIQSPRPRRGERTEDGAHFGDPVIGGGLGWGTGP